MIWVRPLGFFNVLQTESVRRENGFPAILGVHNFIDLKEIPSYFELQVGEVGDFNYTIFFSLSSTDNNYSIHVDD